MNLIPPCDRNTKNLTDVYKFEHLISEEELNSLMGAICEIIENKDDLKDIKE